MNDYKSFIEVQFPVSKVSKESYKERKANLGQTLTGLGKWWGRKPLVLVRAALLGLLMPASDNPKKDMDIFLKILSMDKQGLKNRKSKAIPTKEIFEEISEKERSQYFDIKDGMAVPLWKKGITNNEKNEAQNKAWYNMSYDKKLTYCIRPEEYKNENPMVWKEINEHFGTNARNIQELISELGKRRFGRVPVVGDCFCGGGSVPFEAARIGCSAFGSDLNPVAGLLTWADLNIAGASDEKVKKLREFQKKVYDAVNEQIIKWGIETNEKGERANSYLYCVETTCPECGYKVPLSPSWIIGKGTMTAAILNENKNKGFDIEIKSGLSREQLDEADEMATIRNGNMYCPHCKKTIPVSALRKDTSEGYGLRRWEKDEFVSRENDVFRERLYCIRYEYEKEYLDKKGEPKKKIIRYYTAPSEADLKREQKVIKLFSERFNDWQEKGYIPSNEIEPGDKTNELIRTRGWTQWHQLFNPRQLLVHGLFMKNIYQIATTKEELVIGLLGINKCCNFNSKLTRWLNSSADEHGKDTFYNQALNTLYNYSNRALVDLQETFLFNINNKNINQIISNIILSDARNLIQQCDIWITDPPYADAVNYHELSEFFLAWDAKLLKKAFPDWYADSKRVLAVRGKDEVFNSSMIEIYKNLASHMPDNGMQIIMFTHQDVSVWADLRNIVWSAGLQVTAAWTIATETENVRHKEGNYVKATVLLVVRKRNNNKTAFMDEVMPEVEDEVRTQINNMRSIDDKDEPNFNDADYILSAYAASLKVLTSYKCIEDIDIAHELSREKNNGDISPVEQVIENARKIAYDELIPDEFESSNEKKYYWKKLSPEEKFYIKGLELEKNNIYKLSAYQELAQGYNIIDYKALMKSAKANSARLKTPIEWGNKKIKGDGFAGTLLRNVFMALYLSCKNKDNIKVGKNWLKNEVPIYDGDGRKMIIVLLEYIETFKNISNMSQWDNEMSTAHILRELVENDGV